MDLLIKNGKIVSPTDIISACIGVDKGKIVAITTESSLPEAGKTIDAQGRYILPGVLDMHCHKDFPGKEEDGFAPWAKISKTEPMAAFTGT